jgi:hypothetical protein
VDRLGSGKDDLTCAIQRTKATPDPSLVRRGGLPDFGAFGARAAWERVILRYFIGARHEQARRREGAGF